MELTTIAKPYAKAIKEIAAAAGNYENWQTTLNVISAISKDKLSNEFISSPKLGNQDKISFISKSLSSIINRELNKEEANFVSLLIENNRFNASSSISELFNSFAVNAVQKISVISAHTLDEEERSKILAALTKKYNNEVSLEESIDADLVGGVVIKDGDKVIDLSINASVEKLAACLAKN